MGLGTFSSYPMSTIMPIDSYTCSCVVYGWSGYVIDTYREGEACLISLKMSSKCVAFVTWLTMSILSKFERAHYLVFGEH